MASCRQKAGRCSIEFAGRTNAGATVSAISHWKPCELPRIIVIVLRAARRGWSPAEIDDALMDLAAYRQFGRLVDRLTDLQIATAWRRLGEPEWPAPPSTLC